MRHEIRKLSDADINTYLGRKNTEELTAEFKTLQAAVYTMVGGGMLGQSAACSPESFYIDARVSKRPYPDKAILQAVHVLTMYARKLNLNPCDLPNIPSFHNCGIF